MASLVLTGSLQQSFFAENRLLGYSLIGVVIILSVFDTFISRRKG